MSAHRVRQLLGARLILGVAMVWLVIETSRPLYFAQSDAFFIKLGLSRGGMQSLWLWQPLTYGFVHSGWVHLMMNLLLLVGVGSRLEWMLGRRVLVLVLFGGFLLGVAYFLGVASSFHGVFQRVGD